MCYKRGDYRVSVIKTEETDKMENVNMNALLNAEVGGFSIGKILSAILVLIVCLIIKKALDQVIGKILKKSKMDDKVENIVGKVIDVVLVFLIIMLVASTLGVDTSSLIALATALSLGVSLALNDVIANIAGGLVMLEAKTFTIGDYIELNGIQGTVKEIHLARTKIQTLDNQIITIPNKDVAGSTVTNYTDNTTRRTNIVVTASYDSDPETVKKALMEAITDEKTVLTDPAPSVFLTNYGSSSIEYTLYFWTENADWLSAKLDILDRIHEKFAKYGVSMSYNHVNVHMIEK